MVANTAPIFSKAARADWAAAAVVAANTAKDGTGTVTTVFTAGATDGSFVQKIVIRPLGTNVATVMRVFLNNGATNATPANNTMIAAIGLPATTVSETTAQIGVEFPLNLPIPATDRLFVTLGTAVAAGFAVTVFGGDY